MACKIPARCLFFFPPQLHYYWAASLLISAASKEVTPRAQKLDSGSLWGCRNGEKPVCERELMLFAPANLRVETNNVGIFMWRHIRTTKGQQQTALHAQTKQDVGNC